MEYTKGEWKLYPRQGGQDGERIYATQEDGFETDDIALVYDISSDVYQQEDEGQANAHLIASAPDLYEALKQLTIMYEINDMSVALMDIHDLPVSWGNALKALAKAEGK